MTPASLLVAAFAALSTGQGFDAVSYQIYQARLAQVVSVEGPSTPGSAITADSAIASTGRAFRNASLANSTGCLLAPGPGNVATTSACITCHSNHVSGRSHPVDVPQDGARSRMLRSAAEVVRRGVFLADGKVTCLSCHDGNSVWKYKIALPPESKLQPRTKPGDPSTYDRSLMRPVVYAGLDAATVKTLLPAGTDVSPTPLCKACHAFD